MILFINGMMMLEHCAVLLAVSWLMLTLTVFLYRRHFSRKHDKPYLAAQLFKKTFAADMFLKLLCVVRNVFSHNAQFLHLQ